MSSQQRFDCGDLKGRRIFQESPVAFGGSRVTGILCRVYEDKSGPAPHAGIVLQHRQGKQMVKPDLLEIRSEDAQHGFGGQDARLVRHLGITPLSILVRCLLGLAVLVVLRLDTNNSMASVFQFKFEGNVEGCPVLKILSGQRPAGRPFKMNRAHTSRNIGPPRVNGAIRQLEIRLQDSEEVEA